VTWNSRVILAVVPARGGSKGIPRKNLQRIGGISLVACVAGLCARLSWLDAAVLSTDDDEIAREGEAHGLAVPFRRPAELAGDSAGSVAMWRHAWQEAEEHFGRVFELSILLEPTSPLRTVEDIERTVEAVAAGAPAAATVSPTPAHYTPHKTLTVSNNGYLGFYLEEGPLYAIRQQVPEYYHRNGLCYAASRKHLVDEGQIINADCKAVVVKRPVVNIDDQFELDLANWLYERIRGVPTGEHDR